MSARYFGGPQCILRRTESYGRVCGFGNALTVGSAELWPERLGFEPRKTAKQEQQQNKAPQRSGQLEVHEPKTRQFAKACQYLSGPRLSKPHHVRLQTRVAISHTPATKVGQAVLCLPPRWQSACHVRPFAHSVIEKDEQEDW